MPKPTSSISGTDGSLDEDALLRQVVSSHKRMIGHFRVLKSDGNFPERRHRNKLGLTDPEGRALRYHAAKRFWDLARLSEDLRSLRPDEQSPRPSADMYGLLFSRACEPVISETCGEYADLLTQAVIARRGKKSVPARLREELWAEILRFRADLSKWESVSVWVARAWGRSRNPVNFDVEAFKQVLTRRLRMGSSSWLSESDRRIELRLLLSASSTRIRMDNRSKMVALELMIRYRTVSVGVLCAKLDAMNDRQAASAPVPPEWKGMRSWVAAYEHSALNNRVKVFFSKLRRLL